jgi:hypothetical protein
MHDKFRNKLHILDWAEIGIGEIREGIGGEIPERECRIGGFFYFDENFNQSDLFVNV